MNAHTYCTFVVNGQEFGVPGTLVEEVIRHPAVTPVPLAPPVLLGLTHVRGRIIPVVDIRACFGLPRRPERADCIHVILRLPEGLLSLEVDHIRDFVTGKSGGLERVPESAGESLRPLLLGTCRLPDRLLMVIDAGRIAAMTSAPAQLAGTEMRTLSALLAEAAVPATVSA